MTDEQNRELLWKMWFDVGVFAFWALGFLALYTTLMREGEQRICEEQRGGFFMCLNGTCECVDPAVP